MSKILIDGRFVGIGDSQTRYVLEMVKGILVLDKESEYTLLIRPQGIKELPNFLDIGKLGIEKLIRNSKLEIRNLEILIADIPHYSIQEQTTLLNLLRMNKYDLVHFTQFNHPILFQGPFVTTIQDLTLLSAGGNFIKQKAFDLVMSDAAKRSKRIIAISKTTKDEVQHKYGTPDEKISLIYHGVDHERFGTRIKNSELRIRQFKEKYKIDSEYFLYTGAWKTHKNLKRLLQSFEKFLIDLISNYLNKPQALQVPKLVLVGKIDHKEPGVIAEIDRINKKLATRYSLPATIITTGFIEEEELPVAYAGALAYIIPSLSEGFGWPPLEAMACGTPVLSSKISCMPEILGDAACYFDPYDIDDMTNAIAKISNNQKLRQDLTRKGLLQVQKYQWTETAKKTLAVYRKCLNGKT
jgi:glycosyltransferase involved in cell wall biosynthesis